MYARVRTCACASVCVRACARVRVCVCACVRVHFYVDVHSYAVTTGYAASVDLSWFNALFREALLYSYLTSDQCG